MGHRSGGGGHRAGRCRRPRRPARPARIELRITPSIWPFWRRVAGSTVKFSGSRLGNAAPYPDRLG